MKTKHFAVCMISYFLLSNVYSFSQGAWVSKNALPAAGRFVATAFTIGNKGYLGTGLNSAGSRNDFWEYDPIGNSWTQKANFGGGSTLMAIGFSIGNYGYVGCGASNNFWRYNPLTNTWTVMASFPGVARGNSFGFSVAGNGYMGTGYIGGSPGTTFRDFWKYNPVSNTWTKLADFPGGPRYDIDHATFVICDKAYCGGGGDSTGLHTDLWEYDPATNTWSQKVNFPGTGAIGSVGFSICNKGFLLEGSSNKLWMYDPLTNSWSANTPFPGSTRYDLPSFVVNNKAYIGTGLSGPTYLADLWEFSSICTSSAAIAATTSSTVSCMGSSITLTASGGTNYSWNNGATDNPIVVSLTGTTTYTVTGTDLCGTAGTATVTVAMVPPPVAAISGDATVCAGQFTTLTAGGGGTYIWQPGGQTTASIIVTATATITYSVIVSIGSCSDTAVSTVTVISGAVSNQSASFCSGLSYTLPGGTIVSTGGAYIDTLTSSGGCDSIITTTLTVNPNPIATAFSSVTITQGQSVILTASGGGAYSWSNGSNGSSITVTPLVTTLYCVTVTNANNCTDTACVTVTIEPIDCSNTGELFLPNAFSPNNDGENDLFQLYYGNMHCIKDFQLVIYNRWGGKVFETTDSANLWDGTYKSALENTAVFVYYMKATLTNGEKITKKGNVSLIK